MNDDYYLCFALSISDADARKLYELRYGQQPEKVTRDERMVRAGPVPDEMRVYQPMPSLQPEGKNPPIGGSNVRRRK